MQNARSQSSRKRRPTVVGLMALAFAHLKELGLTAVVWLLFWGTIMQPLHLTQEVHALLPASAAHHASIHCDEVRAGECVMPEDDVSKPLNGLQHERHHEAKCAADSQLHLTNVDVVNPAPVQWHIDLIDFAPVAIVPHLETPALPRKSRAPPLNERTPQSPSLPFQSGRAPPVGA